ncbi:MAG: hypothetical protein H7X75_03345 [Burkholderiaceae bacterium]|nr:hypothetical protein [Burkholderiaceae bacterium]
MPLPLSRVKVAITPGRISCLDAPNHTSRRSRSAFAYVLALAIVCVALLLFAPVALPFLGAIASAIMFFIWFKAGVRTGRWLWLRPRSVLAEGEGAAWIAASVVLTFGVIALASGTLLARFDGASFPTAVGTTSSEPGTKSVTYAEPGMQEAVKRALDAASVPYRVESREGKEWISWRPTDNESAERVIQKLVGGPLASGRNISFSDRVIEAAFAEWLSKRGVPHQRVMSHGKPFITWQGDETSDTLIEAFHRDRVESQQARLKDCAKTAFDTNKGSGKKGC